MRKSISNLGFILAVLLVGRPAEAILVEYGYALELSAVTDATGDLIGFLAPGDVITGHFRVDTNDVPDFVSGTSALYEYETTSAGIQIGPTVFEPVVGPFPTFQLGIWDGFEFPPLCTPVPPCPPGVGPRDHFGFGIGQPFENEDGIRIDLHFTLFEDGADAAFIDGLEIPATLPFPLPTGMGVETLLLVTDAPLNGDVFAAEIELVDLTSTLVPEPPAALLAGLAGLAASRRRRNPIG